MAMRERQGDNESISLGGAIYAWAQLLPPGSSAIARALRDQAIWPDYLAALNDWVLRRPSRSALLSTRSMVRWEWESEERARRDGSFRVGERHVLDQVEDREWQDVGVNATLLRTRVRELELGPALPLQELQQLRHVVLDLSALIEYRQPDEITWADALGGGPVMVWLIASVLNELDDAKRADRRRLRRRAQSRSKWIWERLNDALSSTGVEIRPSDRTRLKAWAPPIFGLRDDDHLESALALRSMGLTLSIVSDDTLMAARGTMAGIEVIRLPDWRLPDDDEGGA